MKCPICTLNLCIDNGERGLVDLNLERAVGCIFGRGFLESEFVDEYRDLLFEDYASVFLGAINSGNKEYVDALLKIRYPEIYFTSVSYSKNPVIDYTVHAILNFEKDYNFISLFIEAVKDSVSGETVIKLAKKCYFLIPRVPGSIMCISMLFLAAKIGFGNSFQFGLYREVFLKCAVDRDDLDTFLFALEQKDENGHMHYEGLKYSIQSEKNEFIELVLTKMSVEKILCTGSRLLLIKWAMKCKNFTARKKSSLILKLIFSIKFK